jgi:hypothetical protein
MDRREIFRILGATVLAGPQLLAQHEHAANAGVIDIAAYEPRFFSPSEYRIVDRLSDIIIPDDEQSPGAHAAGVRYFIDTVLHYSDAPMQQEWRSGVAAVNDAAVATFDKPFLECARDAQEQVVAIMARNEGRPETALEKFFGPVKDLAASAYAVSDVGMKQHFGYKGNTAVREFRGCTHPEHQA